MTKIKFKDGTEIVVTNFNAHTNVNNNTGSMGFNTSFSNHAKVREKVTPENMSEITLVTETENVIYSGFNHNITIIETVSELSQNLSISAQKQGGK